MINIKNNKGFTLIELLAVIALLAIVMLIAVNSVLPLIGDSRENAFISTVNNIVDSAETVHLSRQVSGKSGNCYLIDDLVTNKYLDNITTDMYDGYVLVNDDDSYSIVVHDPTNGYYIAKESFSGLVKNEDMVDVPETVVATCPTTSTQVDLSN